MSSEIERSVKQFRRLLLERDAESRAAIRRSFRTAIDGLQSDLTAATNRIAELRAEGKPVRTYRLLQEQRIRQLIARAEIEFQQFSDRVDLELVRAQRDALTKAQADARQLIVDGFGPPPPGAALPIHLLPTEALTQLTASMQPGAPVHQLLKEFAGDAAGAVEDELKRGMTAGLAPGAIAKLIADRLGAASLDRAETIVRNELMRNYRNASLETYKANAHLMDGWTWYSGLGSRTCIVCLAMHGRIFPVTTPFSSHIRCRCVPMPRTKSWRDLGFDIPDSRLTIKTGPEIFATWSEEAQRRALRFPAAYDAYKAGDVDLSDFVGITRSTVWGTGRRRVSLATAKQRSKRAA